MAIIKLDDGRYALRWRDANGKRHYKTLKRMPYKKVKQAHAAILAARDTVDDPSRATVAELARTYLELHGPSLSADGRARAASIIKHHIKADPIGSVVASELKTKDVMQWRQRRRAEAGDGEKVSDATLDREFNVLRAVVNFGVASDELPTSPLKRGAVKRLVSSAEGRIVYFTPEEWRAFIAALDDPARWSAHVEATRRDGPVKIGATIDTPRVYGGGRRGDSDATAEYRTRLLAYKPFFSALLWTGCRLSEVRMLTWENVDLRAGLVHVHQTKTSKPKIIPMADELRAVFESLPRGIRKAFVFTRDGQPFSKKEVQRAFTVYRKVAGLRDELTVHTIRHTVASWMVIAGRPIAEVREFLGHRSMTMTLRYVHLSPVHLTAAVNALQTMRDSVTNDAGGAKADTSKGDA